MQLISKGLVPPGGWTYQNIKGDSFDDLVKWVKDHRRNNGIEIGSPECEIELYFADKFPELRLTK